MTCLFVVMGPHNHLIANLTPLSLASMLLDFLDIDSVMTTVGSLSKRVSSAPTWKWRTAESRHVR